MRPWTEDEIAELLRGRVASPQVSYQRLADNLRRSRNSIQNKFHSLTTNHPAYQKPTEKEELVERNCLSCGLRFMTPRRLFLCGGCKGHRKKGRR